MKALFVGGPRHRRWLEVCPWQRVYYVVRASHLVGKYRRRTLLASNGAAVRFYAWQSLNERESILQLLAAIRRS
jgi:hypothetical protein